jgi:hypothetical protein
MVIAVHNVRLPQVPPALTKPYDEEQFFWQGDAL